MTAIAASSILKLSSRPEAKRGAVSNIQLVSPVSQGLPSADLKFVWQGIPKAKYYVVEAFDTSLELVWRSEPVRLTEFHPPQALREKLNPGKTYYWIVTAVLEDGRKITSRQKEFRITK